MKLGDIVKSKNSGKLYTVVEQKEGRDGFTCENADGVRYYFFDSEVEILEDVELDLSQPSGNDIVNALIVIQNDLFNCKDTMELGQKYKNYSELLSQFLLKGIEKLCDEANRQIEISH